MSLIPFILDLADELHEFNRCLAAGGMDVDDFGFGIYPHELRQHQQQQQHQQHLLQPQTPQQTRRPRTVSHLYWMPSIGKGRHHPYYRSKTCCNKGTSHLLSDSEKESPNANAATTGGGTDGSGDKEGSSPNAAGKSAYSVVNKNGFQVSMNVKQFAPNELTVKTIDNCIVVEGQHEDKEDGHGVISRHFIRKYMLPKGYDPNEVLSTLSSDGILTVKAPPPATKTDEPMARIVDIQQTGPAQQSVKDTSSKEQAKTTVTAVAAAVAPAPAPTNAANATAAAPQQKQLQQELQKQPPQQPLQQQELQKSHERNGNANPNEISTEQETEPAEPTTSSSSNASHSSSSNANSNANSNSNSNSNKESGTLLLISNVVTPTTNDAIMAAAGANDEDNEGANMDLDENVNVHVHVDSGSNANTDNDASTSANSISTKTTNNNNSTMTTTSTNINTITITNVNANANAGASANVSGNDNGNDNGSTNDNGIMEIPTAAAVPLAMPTPTDGTVVAIETVPVAVIDGVIAEDDMDGMDAVSVGVGIGIAADVVNSARDVDSKAVDVENLVVAAQSPTAGDLVAAADAAILLAKTQCENANGQKVAITEEITN